MIFNIVAHGRHYENLKLIEIGQNKYLKIFGEPEILKYYKQSLAISNIFLHHKKKIAIHLVQQIKT